MQKILMACQKADLQSIELLLEHGAKADLCNDRGRTCLHALASNPEHNPTRKENILRLLKDHMTPTAVNLSDDHNGSTALHVECYKLLEVVGGRVASEGHHDVDNQTYIKGVQNEIKILTEEMGADRYLKDEKGYNVPGLLLQMYAAFSRITGTSRAFRNISL